MTTEELRQSLLRAPKNGYTRITPQQKEEMNAYCKKRNGQKTSTKLGHKGLIKVRRFIIDDTPLQPDKPSESGYKLRITGGMVNLRTGPGTQYTAIEQVKKGDVLCIVEAMKLMNEITAEEDGIITEICAENGQVVEYGYFAAVYKAMLFEYAIDGKERGNFVL